MSLGLTVALLSIPILVCLFLGWLWYETPLYVLAGLFFLMDIWVMFGYYAMYGKWW